MPDYTYEELQQLWECFFDSPDGIAYITDGIERNGQRYLGLISIAMLYPDDQSLYVDWFDIDRFDTEFSAYLLEYPERALETGEQAIRDLLPPDFRDRFPNCNVHLRVLHLSDSEKVPLPEISVKHVDQLISIEGMLRKTTPIYPTLRTAAYKCVRCGAIQFRDQKPIWVMQRLQEPFECSKDQGGCGRAASSTGFEILIEESTFINTEKFEIQDMPEGAYGGKVERKYGYLYDDQAGNAQPGDRVRFTAIVRAKTRSRRGVPSIEYEFLLEIIGLEVLDRTYEKIALTDKDKDEIKAQSKSPELFEHLVDSIAPSVYGYLLEKEAIALQLVGAMGIQMPDGTRQRGDVHILLIGDPGTAKTVILQAVSELAPRGMYLQARQTSASGLTASAVKDEEFGEGGGKWTLEAGAMVLMDGGSLCISDIHNMNEKDMTVMHDALEQQYVSIAKAGITAKLNCRCSVLADANPKDGRWDDMKTVSEQIGLTPPIISRFDAIFMISDKPNKSKDEAIAQHILVGHSNENEMKAEYQPHFDTTFMRKYLAYAKTINPKLVVNGEAFNMIKDFYLETRSRPEAIEEGVVTVTPRQLGGLVRFASASARARLSETVELEDAERSIKINKYYLNKFVTDTGIWDVDMIASGTSHSQRKMIKTLCETITSLEAEGPVKESDIISEMTDYEEGRIKTTLKTLLRDGRICKSKGSYRVG